MEEFKVKAHGQKIKLRPMGPDEIINDRTVYSGSPDDLKKNKSDLGAGLLGSKCQGEKVSDHPGRHYYEVLSPFYEIH